MLHYGFIVLVIAVIMGLQITFFNRNKGKQNELKSIFPKDCSREIIIAVRDDISVIVPISETTLEQIANEQEREIGDIEKELQKLINKKDKLLNKFSKNNKLSDSDKQESNNLEIVNLENQIEQLIWDLQDLTKKRNSQLAKISNLTNSLDKFSSTAFNKIIYSINNYLMENKGAASDFHLIKDVVDRNCDSEEEEIATLTPIPLYLGLIGTMAGILIGVGFLVASGGIQALLSTQVNHGADKGIIDLLGGVALAMISSISGIVLTTTASYYNNASKKELNTNKNSFLSWIQVKLLPTLSGNAATAIYTLQQNLSTFNNTFSTNIKEMGTAFTIANQSHHDQLELMRLVEKMDVTRMAKANVEVLQELQRNSKEFEKFNQYLHCVTGYLDKVQTLSSEVNEHLNRTKAIEDMGVFFKDEIKQIEERKGAISSSVGVVDVTLQRALNKLQDSSEEQLNEFIKLSVIQQQKLSKTIEDQQYVLSTTVTEQQKQFMLIIEEQKSLLLQKMEETSLLIEELKSLSSVKTSMISIEKAANEQNIRIADLTTAIEKLSKTKNEPYLFSGETEIKAIMPEIPYWVKIFAFSSISIISVAGLIVIILFVLSFAL